MLFWEYHIVIKGINIVTPVMAKNDRKKLKLPTQETPIKANKSMFTTLNIATNFTNSAGHGTSIIVGMEVLICE